MRDWARVTARRHRFSPHGARRRSTWRRSPRARGSARRCDDDPTREYVMAHVVPGSTRQYRPVSHYVGRRYPVHGRLDRRVLSRTRRSPIHPPRRLAKLRRAPHRSWVSPALEGHGHVVVGLAGRVLHLVHRCPHGASGRADRNQRPLRARSPTRQLRLCHHLLERVSKWPSRAGRDPALELIDRVPRGTRRARRPVVRRLPRTALGPPPRLGDLCRRHRVHRLESWLRPERG